MALKIRRPRKAAPGAKTCPRCKRMVPAENMAQVEYVEMNRRVRMCLDCAWKVITDNGATPPKWMAPELFSIDPQQKGK